MNKLLAVLLLTALSSTASAACRWVFVDHDYNAGTPAIRKQICDSVIDVPAIRSPAIAPIQAPQIRPINPIGINPIGTSRCRMESVYNTRTRQWENQRVCR